MLFIELQIPSLVHHQILSLCFALRKRKRIIIIYSRFSFEGGERKKVHSMDYCLEDYVLYF
jgi:hypothetical protein